MSLATRIKSNLRTVLGAELIVALLGMVTLLINARALGPSLLGTLVLIQFVPGLVRQVIRFDLWQPMVALGAKVVEINPAELGNIATKSIFVEILEGIVACLVAIVVLGHFGQSLGLSETEVQTAMLFALSLCLVWSSSATGVLRLLNQFPISARITVAASVAHLIISITFAVLGASVGAYAFAFAMINVAQNLATNFAATRALRVKGADVKACYLRSWDRELSTALGSFASSTFLLNAVNTARQNLDTVALGVFFGTSAVGYYHMAHRFASILTKLNMPLQYVVFPEISRLSSVHNLSKIRQLFNLWNLLGTVAGILIALMSVPAAMALIALLGPAEFSQVAAPFIWLCFAYALSIAAFHFRPIALHTIGPKVYLRTLFVALIFYVPIVTWALPQFGLFISGASQVGFNVVWYLLNLVLIRKYLGVKRKHSRASLLWLKRKISKRFIHRRKKDGSLPA